MTLSGERVGGVAGHVAARVLAEAGPGEVLLSDTTRDLAEGGGGLAFESRGRYRLKGLEREHELFVAGPDAEQASHVAPLGVAGLVQLEQVEHFADLVVELRRVTHPGFPVKRVAASASDALTSHEAAFHEVGDDSLHGSLRDPDRLGNITQARLRVTRDTEKHLGVVGEEAPRFRGFLS